MMARAIVTALVLCASQAGHAQAGHVYHAHNSSITHESVFVLQPW
jgi:hypothetical protein